MYPAIYIFRWEIYEYQLFLVYSPERKDKFREIVYVLGFIYIYSD